MKNKIVIHKSTSYQKIILKYILALIPLIFYGLYKNGIILYLNKEINFLNIFKPLLFPFLGFIFGIVINYIKTKKINLCLSVLNGLIIGMVLPLNTNIIIFSVITLGLLYGLTFIEKKLKFNTACLIKLIIVLVLFLLGKYDYSNSIELASSYDYSFIDMLFGRQVGGVCSSSFLWIIVGFVYLATDYYYKKDIPVIAYLAYAVVSSLSYIFTKDLNLTFNMLIAAAPVFCFVFIAPISEYSPYTSSGKVIYAILIGVITAIISFILSYEAAFIACLLMSLIASPIDSLIRQKITK